MFPYFGLSLSFANFSFLLSHNGSDNFGICSGLPTAESRAISSRTHRIAKREKESEKKLLRGNCQSRANKEVNREKKVSRPKKEILDKNDNHPLANIQKDKYYHYIKKLFTQL